MLLSAFAGAHPGGGANKARQLVGGEEDLFHLMLRRYVGTRSVGMADDSVNQLLTGPGLLTCEDKVNAEMAELGLA